MGYEELAPLLREQIPLEAKVMQVLLIYWPLALSSEVLAHVCQGRA